MRRDDLNLEDILTDRVREEDLLEVPLTERVFKISFALAALLIVAVMVRLGDLGVLKHDFYRGRALANMMGVQVEQAPRGVITDRFGKPLVHNEPSFNAYLIPRYLPLGAKERIELIKRVEDILGVPSGDLGGRMERKDWSMSDRLLLSDNLTQDQLVALSAANFPGVQLEPGFKRVHEAPLAYAHLVGYTGLVGEDDLQRNPALVIDDVVGRAGLEAYYDQWLRGTNGEAVTIRDAHGDVAGEQQSKPPEPGMDLATYIDRDFQDFFYQRLTNALGALGRRAGVGIALNPQNGEVLALVSVPSFDASNVHRYLTQPYQPLFNRAVTGRYTPGSTIKPLVAVAALSERVITPNTQILSTGSIEIPNPYNQDRPSRFLDWRAHGWVDLRAALARSSNVYFYEVGGGFEGQRGLGINRLRSWWDRFQLDEQTGIDLANENVGFLPDPDWKERTTGSPWRIGDTYNVSIGQGDLLVTPMELLNYIGAIANGGTFYKPRVVAVITDGKDNMVRRNEPVVLAALGGGLGEVIAEVQHGMRDAVAQPYGTAHLLEDLPIPVAAKTGSAQIENNRKTNAFFVGYAPAEQPQIAILVLIEDALEGSLNAVPVARDVLLWYYEHRLRPAHETGR